MSASTAEEDSHSGGGGAEDQASSSSGMVGAKALIYSSIFPGNCW